MKIWIPLILAATLGCTPPSSGMGYDWKGYDDNLYSLMKNPDNLGSYGSNLKKQIERNPDGKRLPPGIYAEYGYVLYTGGHKSEASIYFSKEKLRWPESSKIMDKMITNCARPAPTPEPMQIPNKTETSASETPSAISETEPVPEEKAI